MSVTRVPSLLEQSIKSNAGGTNPAVRQQLDVYSKAEVDAEINQIDLSPYALTSTVASISGGLDARIDALEGTVVNLDNTADALAVTVQNISAALTTDIENLDLAFTQKIAVDCMQSAAVSGAGTTLTGHIIVNINGISYKLATVL